MALNSDTCGQAIYNAFNIGDSNLTDDQKAEALNNFKILSSVILDHIKNNGEVKINIDNISVDNEGAIGTKIGQIDNSSDIIGNLE